MEASCECPGTCRGWAGGPVRASLRGRVMAPAREKLTNVIWPKPHCGENMPISRRKLTDVRLTKSTWESFGAGAAFTARLNGSTARRLGRLSARWLAGSAASRARPRGGAAPVRRSEDAPARSAPGHSVGSAAGAPAGTTGQRAGTAGVARTTSARPEASVAPVRSPTGGRGSGSPRFGQ